MKAIFTMTTFDYNYQNSFCFCFLISICQSRWGLKKNNGPKGRAIRNNRRWGDNSQKNIPARETCLKKSCKRWYVGKKFAEEATRIAFNVLKILGKGGGGGGDIKQCLKRKRTEILNSDLFCVILFTLLFKEASQSLSHSGSFLTFFSSIQCSIKYVLYEWSLSMIY